MWHGGISTLPPRESTWEGSNPLGEEKTTEQEQVLVGDVVGMIRSF